MYAIHDNTIEFSWNADDLFARIVRQSAYYTRSRQTPEGADPWETVGLSDDEKPYVRETLADVFRHLSALFVKLTATVPDSLFAAPEETGETTARYGFSIEKSRDESGDPAFNANRLETLDGLCGEYAINEVLLHWGRLNGLADETAVRTAEQEGIVRRIREELHYLRLGMPERCYTLIRKKD